MGTSLKIISSACLTGWCYFYGSWVLFLEILLSSFPMIIVGTLFLLISVYIIRLAPPPSALVEEVLGKDLEIEADEDENVEASKDFPYRMGVIAHRGCGFDAPENSMTAVRMVHAYEYNLCMAPICVCTRKYHKCNTNKKVSLCEMINLFV
jgi:hypothetical protein